MKGEKTYNRLCALVRGYKPGATDEECSIYICKALGVDYNTIH